MTTDVAETEVLPEAQVETPLTELDKLAAEEMAAEEPQVEAEAPEAQAVAEPEAEPEPEAPAPPQPRSMAEIQAAVDAGEPITSVEREAYRAEVNRQRAAAQAREHQRQRDAALKEKRESFAKKVNDTLIEEIQNANAQNRMLNVELLDMKLNRVRDDFLADIEPITLEPQKAAIRTKITQSIQEAGGNPQLILDWLEAQGGDLQQEIDVYAQVQAQIAARNSDAGQKLATLETENARLKAEVERLTSGNGKGTVSSQGKGAVTDNRSTDDILLDPDTPIDVINKILGS